MKKFAVLIFIMMILVVGCTTKKDDFSSLEKELTEKATKYYDDYIKGKVLGVNNHQITLDALEKAGVDIKNFSKKSCDRSSYALIKLNLNENGEAIGNVEIENYLICGEYTTKNEK